jgi:Raf kinase inhibitor-like YbhB/YbcL family protein
MAIVVTSSAFEQGERIPTKHTGEGEDVSPPLQWEGVPQGTQELALICDDPDAPTPQPWVHWVLFSLSAGLAGLGEGANGGGVEGMTDFGKPGYGGPMPPKGHGVHRYYFKLYALDVAVDLPAGATKSDLLTAMEGHVLAQGELMGTYERP